MSFNLEYIYQIVDRYSGPINAMKRNTEGMRKTLLRTQASFKRTSESINNLGKNARNFGAGLTAMVSAPIIAMGASSLSAAAQLETMSASFESMLKSGEKAQKMMTDLKAFSAGTPFQLPGIASTAKMLMGFGVSQDKIIDRLKMLGDVAAGTNRPLSEIGQVFGKIMAKGKMQGEELLQFQEKGIPIMKAMSELYGKSEKELQAMVSKGKISFEMVDASLKKLTSGSGIYADQMKIQSETLGGLWSTLKDNFFLFNAGLGKTISKVFGVKDILKSLTKTLQSWTVKIKEFTDSHPKMVKIIATIATIAVVAGPALAALGLMVMGIGGVVSAVGALAGVVGVLMGPLGIAIALGAAIALSWGRWVETSHPLVDTIIRLYDAIGLALAPLGKLIGSSGEASEGFSSMNWLIDKFGTALQLTIVPLEVIVNLIGTITSAIDALMNVGIDAAMEKAGEGLQRTADSIMSGFSAVGDLFGVGGSAKRVSIAENVAVRRENNSKVDLTGNVRVSAEKGTQIKQANIGLNGGANLATAQ